MSKIESIKAREILDSRGNPTVEVTLRTKDGFFISSSPSGASTGTHEAVELRDGGERYHGKGVLKAVENVNRIIAPKIIGREASSQEEIDNLLEEIDGTDNFSSLGANATLAVSTAVCRAGSFSNPLYRYISELARTEIKMPQASFNLINGGAHAGNDLSFQEFMIIPEGETFKERLRIASESYHSLKKRIEKKYSRSAINVGDEGGFAPPISDPREALDLLPKEIDIALDVAATEFFRDGRYEAGFKSFSSDELLDYYISLAQDYPIISIEDPFAEDDWNSWVKFSKASNLLLIGDDLLVTNPKRINRAIEEKACNGMILKLNQIGTVTLGIKAAKIARENDWQITVSHRSGETTDDFIADFSVAIGADYIKSGAPARGERVVKYNRLLLIEEEL